MRIVLTGASGFIGRRLARVLAEKGHQVAPVARQQWDVAGSLFPAGVVENADAVIHLAGEPVAQRWTAGAKVRIRASRTQGTARVVEAIAGAGRPPRVLVCASAIGYYGDRGEESLTEESAAGQDFLAGVCRGWEAAAMQAAGAGCR
ncbi:MAG: NAD-dependent epimerase/dehydratase family protein, partial [Acidobacteria bacterium]|nr:NAD-dependent epimerase/dehydratase family protein [Acidobacteriota bacterium]